MTDQPAPFSIQLGALKKRDKEDSPRAVEKAVIAGEKHGFIDREPKRRGGRLPSPRTGQVHAKVLPHVAQEILEESRRTGKTQGVLLEEAWALYCAQKTR
ncbi:hypothetical protein FBZ89_1439 [Nitrospirillum amazonense]|uniref:Chromosome partitioning protein ParB n=1 Tax=Nitrospirillum amazonense TaxID=28077 RepID=A0A560EIV5_9PROT|nr:chromosome partitioning protein ParB [Nitrospirillum amazonense]TWB09311.1 hypothetical protein FBZ89_1439 [Nitrospirillum amazonense]